MRGIDVFDSCVGKRIIAAGSTVPLLAEVPADAVAFEKAGNHRECIGVDHDPHDDEQHAAHR